ncbi:hypothetical protein Tcan_10303 [Toxocara canis]|uniref:G_PROTEIN_RECEP_F1_2 domain-containing protein n=1 Tax=Toxocara canis TaxID=6265 RepID=A0A0B2W026_TOXCA|nr:hypothetical protein Tcan_10303 [Toxocara canis]
MQQAPCVNRGINCPELFDAEHCVIYIAVALRTVITIFVMYISIAKLKGDPVKLYTLNLYSASILSDVSSTALLMFRVTLLYRADIASSVWYTVTEVITDFAYTLVAVLYRLLSLFYVIVSIIPYTAPIFFKLHFTNRSWAPWYAVMQAISYIVSFFLVSTIALPEAAFIKVFSVINGVFDGLLVLLSFLTLFATIKAVAVVKGYKPQSNTNNAENERLQRKRLISFLIYSIPMNIFNVPLIANDFAYVLELLWPHEPFIRYIRPVVSSVDTHFDSFRTVVIGLCTLIALSPYRDAAVCLLGIRHLIH